MIICRVCGGACGALGRLGRALWFRCIDCGMEQYLEIGDYEDEETE